MDVSNSKSLYKSYFEQAVLAANFAITGGARYLWKSFGPNARFLDFDKDNRVSLGLVFDTQTQDLYQGSLFVGDKAYIWTNPAYINAYKEECYDRGIDPRVALDDIRYIECNVAEDFIEKITEAFTNGVCSPYVKLNVDFSPEVQAFIDGQPEEFDLDAFVNDALRREVTSVQLSNEENVREVLKAMEGMSLNEGYINTDSAIGRGNIEEIVNWIRGVVEQSGLTSVKVMYSNKEVREGLQHTLRIEPGFYTFDYFYKS